MRVHAIGCHDGFSRRPVYVYAVPACHVKQNEWKKKNEKNKSKQEKKRRMLANFRRVSAQRCSPISDLTFFFPPERGKKLGTSASRFRSRSCLSSTRSKVNLFMIALKYSLDTRHNARALAARRNFFPDDFFAFICACSRDLRRARAPHLLWIARTFVNYKRRSSVFYNK